MKHSIAQNLKQMSPIRNGHHRSGGFVLVAVLLLIALAVVLVVTVSSVSQTERKAISNSSKQELARQNALFALNLAVSQLQVAAGPDQRVSATADILNTNSANPSPVAQPYWAGVWKTANPAWLADSVRTTAPGSAWFRPEPSDTNLVGSTNILRSWSTAGGATNANVTWLVSGATNNTIVTPLSTTTSWMSNSIVLASNWGTGTNGSITGGVWTNPTTVTVPLVTLTNGATNIGRYAYWVSDEGVKAKVTLTDTNMSTAAITTGGMIVSSLLHAMAPAAHNISSAMTNYGISSVLTTDFRSNTNLSKLTSLGGIAFITNNVPVFTNNTLAVDLTPYSYGVLSDTRNGGLRQDLTAAFEATGSGNTNYNLLYARSGSGISNDAVMLFRTQNSAIPALTTTLTGSGNGTAPNSVFDGMRWQSFYNYYNLYKSLMSLPPSSPSAVAGAQQPTGIGSLTTTPPPPTLSSRVPKYKETNTGGGVVTLGYLTPCLIADRSDCMITPITTTSMVGTNLVSSYTFAVNYYPMLVMMNPYPVYLDVTKTLNSLNQSPQNPTVTLTSGTNRITNAIWQCYTPATKTVTSTISNLWPYDPHCTNNALNSPAANLYQLYMYSITEISTYNMTAMAPGEIRVLTLGASSNNTSMSNAVTMSNCTPTNSSLSYSSYYIQTNWTGSTTNGTWIGTTNPNDPISISLSSYTQTGFQEKRWNPGSGNGNGGMSNNVSGWPALAGGAAAFNSTYLGVLPPTQKVTSTQTTISATISTIPTAGIRVLGLIERLKGTYPAPDTNFFFSSNNLPMFLGNSTLLNGPVGVYPGLNLPGRPTTEIMYASGNSGGSTASLFQVLTNANGLITTCWGINSVGGGPVITNQSANNNCSFVLYDIPIAPMTSLGQFMHLVDKTFDGAYNNYSIPPLSLGGSYASVDLSTNPALAGVTNTALPNGQTVDNSFMGNEALFDTYFFSTVPPTSGFNWGSGGYGAFSNSTITASSIAAGLPLPNSRLVYYRKNGSNPVVSDIQNESKASANLLLDGAFNVNSTSVAAWKALLTSLSGQSYIMYNYLLGRYETRTPINPIFRFWSVCRSAVNDPWDGMRSLTDAQVTALATEIVKQVRLRGPFLSLGDFLNRRLGPTSTTPLSMVTMGALQAAIENTQTNGSTYDVNSNIHNVFPAVGTSVTNLAIATIATNSATGIPGYLMQQDLVQAFAPVLTARSDTFVIRVYGESDKPSTSALTTLSTYSQAWGEAVVQRLPEYFDQNDTSLTATTNIPAMSTGIALGDATPLLNGNGLILNSANQTCGRRFKIISFRWLNQNEL